MYELPDVYGVRRVTGGSPVGILGNMLVAVVGRGDKKLPSVVMGAPVLKTGTGLEATTTYYWKITAYNDLGETVGSSEVTATTDTTKKQVILSWTPVLGAVGYKIYRSTSAGAYVTPSLVVNVVGSTASSFIDSVPTASLAAGVPPTTSTALLVPYNTPQIYYSMSKVKDNHGLATQLGICALIAEKFNLGRLMVVSVDYTTIDDAVGDPAKLIAKQAQYQISLDALLRKQLDIVVVMEPEPEITAIVKQHLSVANSSENKMFRTAAVASALTDTIGDTLTSASIIYNANTWKDFRVIPCAPNTPVLTYVDESGTPVQATLTGSFTAFAVACKKVVIGDQATALTGATFSVFDEFTTEFMPSELKALLAYGVSALTSQGGVQTIVDGVSCDVSSEVTKFWEITTAEDFMIKTLVEDLKPFIGKKVTRHLRDAIFNKTTDRLLGLTQDAIITGFSQLEVVQDSVTTSWVRVRFQYQYMRSARVIFLDYAIDLATGAFKAA
jgi:hypothetical protein